jgi:hypothetical protein
LERNKKTHKIKIKRDKPQKQQFSLCHCEDSFPDTSWHCPPGQVCAVRHIVPTLFQERGEQSPDFGGEIARLHCNKRSAAQVSYLAMTFSYRELLPFYGMTRSRIICSIFCPSKEKTDGIH